MNTTDNLTWWNLAQNTFLDYINNVYFCWMIQRIIMYNVRVLNEKTIRFYH